jgi:hypothetical protein
MCSVKMERSVEHCWKDRDEETEILLEKPVPVPQLKGKRVPLQAWTDPEVSRRLGLPDFKTIGS